MQKFASIGKALLIRAVGIQENYIEEITGMIDVERSGCNDCIHSFYPDSNACKDCPNKCYITKKVYVNEKNMYGQQSRLNANALKMLIYFHFLRPDTYGIIKNVSITGTADALNCTRRTVINNMKLLDKHGYIKYTQTYNGNRNVLLLNYADAFKKAEEGGKGYVVFNDSFFKKIINLDKIVLLRIYLRNMVEIDGFNKDDRGLINMVTKSYKSMKRSLPAYCTKKLLNSLLMDSTGSDIFHVKQSDDGFVFSLNRDYIAKRKRRELVKKYYEEISRFVHDLNESALKKKDGRLTNGEKFQDFFFDIPVPELMILLEDEIHNLAQLAVYYELDVVEDAILYSYKYRIETKDTLLSVGAFVRNYIEKAYGRMAS